MQFEIKYGFLPETAVMENSWLCKHWGGRDDGHLEWLLFLVRHVVAHSANGERIGKLRLDCRAAIERYEDEALLDGSATLVRNANIRSMESTIRAAASSSATPFAHGMLHQHVTEEQALASDAFVFGLETAKRRISAMHIPRIEDVLPASRIEEVFRAEFSKTMNEEYERLDRQDDEFIQGLCYAEDEIAEMKQRALEMLSNASYIATLTHPAEKEDQRLQLSSRMVSWQQEVRDLESYVRRGDVQRWAAGTPTAARVHELLHDIERIEVELMVAVLQHLRL